MSTRSERLRALGFSHWETGGGCTALGLERADGAQLLITTDAQDPYDMPDQAPHGDDTVITLGEYSPEGEQIDWTVFQPTDEDTQHLCEFVEQWVTHEYDATGGDDVRASGVGPNQQSPSADAETGSPEQLLSDLLRRWCEEEGLPFLSGDELASQLRSEPSTPKRVRQIAWLDAFCTLWELTVS